MSENILIIIKRQFFIDVNIVFNNIEIVRPANFSDFVQNFTLITNKYLKLKLNLLL